MININNLKELFKTNYQYDNLEKIRLGFTYFSKITKSFIMKTGIEAGEAKVNKLVKKPAAKKSNRNLYLLFAGIVIMFVLILKVLGKKKKPAPKVNRLDDDFF